MASNTISTLTFLVYNILFQFLFLLNFLSRNLYKCVLNCNSLDHKVCICPHCMWSFINLCRIPPAICPPNSKFKCHESKKLLFLLVQYQYSYTNSSTMFADIMCQCHKIMISVNIILHYTDTCFNKY